MNLTDAINEAVDVLRRNDACDEGVGFLHEGEELALGHLIEVAQAVRALASEGEQDEDDIDIGPPVAVVTIISAADLFGPGV